MITVKIPGLADTAFCDGGFRQDEPEIFARYEAGCVTRRVGRFGHIATVTLAESDWARVAQYLASLEGAMGAGVGDNPDDHHGRSEWKAVGVALDRIAAELPEWRDEIARLR